MFVLFITQRLHRFDFRRASRREPTRQRCDGQKQRGDNSERERVSGLNFVEESSHETRQGKRCGESGTRADEREFEALSNHEGEDVARLRPKRHANAYLLCPLRYGVGQQTVQSDRSQEQRKRGKQTQQPRMKARLRDGFSDE